MKVIKSKGNKLQLQFPFRYLKTLCTGEKQELPNRMIFKTERHFFFFGIKVEAPLSFNKKWKQMKLIWKGAQLF